MADEEIKQKIIEHLQSAKKRQKPKDIAKAVSAALGVEMSDVKKAIKELANEGKVVFTYYGSSFVELPGQEEPKEE